MYLLPSHLYCPAMCLPTIWYIIATIRSIIQKCLTVDHPASDLSSRPPTQNGPATFKNMVYSRYQFKCAVQIKKDRIEYKWNITTHQPHPYSYNCNFFLFPYNSITLLKAPKLFYKNDHLVIFGSVQNYQTSRICELKSHWLQKNVMHINGIFGIFLIWTCHINLWP